MKNFICLLGLLLTATCTLSSKLDNIYDLPSNLELQMVNLVFRHGDRTPEPLYGETYPNDPYKEETYYELGYGALTKKGEKRAIKLGHFLRKRYHKFLDNINVSEDIIARSTDVNRTRKSLSFVLSGMFPKYLSQEEDRSIDWQTIPIIYRANYFLKTSHGCPQIQRMISEIRGLPEVIEIAAEFKPLWKNLSKYTGENITQSNRAHSLYNTLISHQSMSLALPKWAEETLNNREFLKSVALNVRIKNYNDTLKKMNGGRLLKKMTNDMIAKKGGQLKEGKKINLYSAHDTNVAAYLLTLGVTKPHQPYYTSAVILELYSDEEKNYYVQVVHYKGFANIVKILKIPNCSTSVYKMCEFNEFRKLMEKVIPTEDELKCCDSDLENCTLI